MSFVNKFFRFCTRPLVDGLIVVASVFLAYLLRFNFDIPAGEIAEIPIVLAIMVVVRVALFLTFRAYTGTDRHPGLAGGFRLVFILISGSFLFILTDFITYYFINQRLFIPLTIIILEFLITTVLIFLFRSLVHGGFDTLLRSVKPAAVAEDSVTGTRDVEPGTIEYSFSPKRTEGMERAIRGKRVLITGAGGTTGTELTRQILAFRPASLILADRSEKALTQLRAFIQNPEQVPVILTLTDITDEPGLTGLFERHRPEMVIHAALYHDAALLESNPGEAFRNHEEGTGILARCAVRHGADRFILLSSYLETGGDGVKQRSMQKAEEAVCGRADQHPGWMAELQNTTPGSPLMAAMILRRPDTTTVPVSLPAFCTLVFEALTTGTNGDIFTASLREPTRKLDQARQMILQSGLQLSGDDENSDTPSRLPAAAKLMEAVLKRI
ncbi:MAG: NAD-dependent epimerase/dehydratase family protein [Alphaproteobacteria bacterium]|nr:NAD-dependent epimerase/dehydratase family protein [Alphaproteobacteria bacterium]